MGSIQKGICDKAQGKNGIKLLSNGMFELKANCDIRLLAKNLYENKHGFTLILFEEMGNHKDIKRICANQKAEVILC